MAGTATRRHASSHVDGSTCFRSAAEDDDEGERSSDATANGVQYTGRGHTDWERNEMLRRGRANDPLWYQQAIIYELPVKSFFDANGDGIGDFAGLIEKLDYVQQLGVTCLWLLPFFPSPFRDDGYDISDYRDIHPSCGTLDDFKRFLRAPHERPLQVVIELVVNHTSDQHAWFQRARAAAPRSRERDYYVWSETDQKYRDARIIFVDSERSNWTWDPVA